MPHAAATGLIPLGIDVVHISEKPDVVTAFCGRRCSRSRDEYAVNIEHALAEDQWLRENWSLCVTCAHRVRALGLHDPPPSRSSRLSVMIASFLIEWAVEIAESRIAHVCGRTVECGSSCWLESGHSGPCCCTEDREGPGTCPA